VYVRATYEDSTVTVMTLANPKSKVAPLKSLTIPKLELCSAALLAKLLRTDGTQLKLDADSIFVLSDS